MPKRPSPKPRKRARRDPLSAIGSSINREQESSSANRRSMAIESTTVPLAEWLIGQWWVIASFVAVVGFCYWPTISWMVDSWQREADYNHGWLILPLAIAIAVKRSDTFPGLSRKIQWGGLAVIGMAVAVRILSGLVYADFMDAWSLIGLIAGGVWLVFGRQAFLWALPAVAFLIFAVPIPFRAEHLLSFQLQGVATELSTILLRVLGQPAAAQGHQIWIGAEPLNIEPACSGLRIFVGLAATAYYFAAITRHGWFDRLVLLVSFVPVAIVVNSLRIVVTGILYQSFTEPATRHAIHDYSGYLMIGVGFLFMYGVSCYFRALYRPLAIAQATPNRVPRNRSPST